MDKRPRIGIFTRPIDQGTSGSGHHLKEIVKHVMKFNTEYDFYFIHYVKNSNNEIYKLAKEIIIPRNPFKAIKVLNKYNFDIFHYSPLTIFSPIWGTKAKRMATIHNAEPLLIPKYYNLIQILHCALILSSYARKMDHIATVSNTSKAFFVNKWKVNSENISICYNSYSKSYKKLKGPFSVLEKHFIDSRFLFHVSKYSGRKNPDTILKAFNLISKKQKDIKLVIAGSGWENDKVLSYINKNKLMEKVIFTGFTSEEDLVELYNSAEVFIFPSRAEGFGIPNIEAMACGCPVITSNVFAVPEVVGDAALVLDDPNDFKDLSNKIEEIINNKELRERLIKLGFERVKRYSWDDSAKTLLNVYKKLLEN